MASSSCSTYALRAINTRPLVHLHAFEFQLARAPRTRGHSLSSKKSFASGTSMFTSNRSLKSLAFKDTELTAPDFKNPYGDREEEQDEMTIKPTVRISDGKLTVKNRTILTGVPDNVVSTSAVESGPIEGAFLGAVFDEAKSRHVVSLGALRDVRFVACFRFKLWWMAQKMGNKGSEIPLETQFLLAEATAGADEPLYAVFLPILENGFRACLQGNDNDEIELCLESGDEGTKASEFTHSVFVHCGTDPFATITEAIDAVKRHLKTFRQRHEKTLPGIADSFGWCTWDAFYQDVTQEGVEAGIRSLADGGTPAKFVIIDDGWQSVGEDESDKHEKHDDKLFRLTGIKENSKFRSKEDPVAGIKNIVDIAKNKLGLKYVYVWHAIIGYWGGVRPEEEVFGSEKRFMAVSEGVVANEPVWKTDKMAVKGLGLVNPRSVYKFYDELHSYLAAAGVDGVKVDVQCVLETLGGGLGGRVELTRRYHQALEASVVRNFPDNGCIACMSHNTDALYCSKQTAIVRASDDFYPRDPMSHTIHIAAVAYNSVFLGEFMQPDWDMFHSLHPAGEYHASARAISGGPIYVSDAPGKHNFELLRKLVLPDGSVLRPRLPGRPTQDCLFSDPARDGISLLKIWNMNKYTGVLGIYNCQGAAWNTAKRSNTFHETSSEALTGHIRARDVHLIAEAACADHHWSGDCVSFSSHSKELVVLPHAAAMPVSLKVLEHEIYTISPIKVLVPGFAFAPLGLIGMYNAGGAIDGLRYEMGLETAGTVHMEVKGCGVFGAYSSAKPRRCIVDSVVVGFSYDGSCGLVTFGLEKLPEEGKKAHNVVVDL